MFDELQGYIGGRFRLAWLEWANLSATGDAIGAAQRIGAMLALLEVYEAREHSKAVAKIMRDNVNEALAREQEDGDR